MQVCKSSIIGCILAVLVLPLAGAVGDASAQNLLVNPAFETGDLAGWLVFGEGPNSSVTVQSTDNGPSLPGTNNAFMDNQGEAIGLTLKQSTVPGSAGPGPVYYAYDLKLDQADVGGVLFVEIFAEQAGGGVIGGSGLIGPLWPWEWTLFEGTFEAPANTDFLTIQIMANTGAAVGSNCLVHVDNVYLSQGGPPIPVNSMSWGNTKALYR
jgi:hypothetical protein